MLTQFNNASVGPIYSYEVPRRVAPNSFYANKFCLYWQDKALQCQLWRVEANRRAIETIKHAIYCIETGYYSGDKSYELYELIQKLNKLEQK